MKDTRLLGLRLTLSLFLDAYAALFVAVLQSLTESGITRRYCTVDSIVDIGGHSSQSNKVP